MTSDSQIEREIKVLMPERAPLPQEDPASGLRLEHLDQVSLISTYWDGPDYPLLARGWTVRHIAGRGWTLKCAGEASDGLLARTAEAFADNAQVPPEIRERAARELGVAVELERVAILAIERTVARVDRGEEQGLAIVTDDLVRVTGTPSAPRRFREVEVELAEGVDAAEVAPLVAALQAQGGRSDQPLPKLERALAEETRDPDHDQ